MCHHPQPSLPRCFTLLIWILLLGGSHLAYAQERAADVTYDYRTDPNAGAGKTGAEAAGKNSGITALTPAQLAMVQALGLEEADVSAISFPGSNPAGYGILSTPASGFPQQGSSYMVLSTGSIGVALNPNNSGSTTGNLGTNVPGKGNDLTRMVLTLNVPAGAQKLTFNFKFFSEEYPEWVNTAFNDGFVVEVGSSTYSVSGNTINAPGNVVFDEQGRLISINTTGNLGMSLANAAGTTYDGATPVLSTEIPVPAGATTMTLIFSIFDVGDTAYDSAVFLDNFKFDRIDLQLVALEVNQAIQDWHNSVRLIRNKNTLVRAFVQSKDTKTGSAENVRLRGTRGGVELPGSPLVATNASTFTAQAHTTSSAFLTNRRKDLAQSLNFQLPLSWTNGSSPVTLELIRSGGELDCAPAVATGADCATNVTFQATDAPKVQFVRVQHTFSGTTLVASNADVVELVNRARAIMPTSSLTWGSRLFTWPTGPAFTLTNVNLYLEVMRFLDCWLAGNCNSLYYGVLRTPTDMGGLANGIPGTVSSGTMPTNPWAYGRNRHVHELGHDAGQPHVTYCGAVASTPPPFPASYAVTIGGQTLASLGPMNAGIQHEVWGYDSHANIVVDPREHFELMSYCGVGTTPWRWISKFTYDNFATDPFNKFPPRFMAPDELAVNESLPLAHLSAVAPTADAQRLNTASTTPQDYLIVVGTINPVTNEVDWQPFLTVNSTQPPPPIQPGTYTLGLIDQEAAGDKVISQTSFGPSRYEVDQPASLGPFGSFIIPIPIPQGTNLSDVEQVTLSEGGAQIAQKTKSPNAPVVQVLSPNGGENLSGSTVNIQWSGSDADGDALVYTVQFSPDAGATWTTLVVNWTTTSLTVPMSLLPQTTQGLIRVIASDGFNTGQDDSNGVFSTPNSPPDAFLLQPGNGSSFFGQNAIYFDGLGQDAEDGNLPDGSLTWMSSLDGLLGTGTGFSVQADALSEGTHTITLRVQDSQGQQGSASVQIEVKRTKPVTDVESTCPTSLLISGFRTTPGAQEYVDITNYGSATATLDGCIIGGFSSKSVSYIALKPSGLLAPGETFRFGASLVQNKKVSFPDNTLLDSYAGLALLNRKDLPNGTPISAITNDIINSFVYLTNHTIYGLYHVDPAMKQMFCTIYAGQLHSNAQNQCSAGASKGTASVAGSEDFEEMMLQMLAEVGGVSADLPQQYTLEQNYPNPFNPSTEIRFALPTGGPVRLVVYDMLGREVMQLVDETLEAGAYSITLDASRLPSGVYLYRLEAGTFSQTRRMVLLK